MPVQVKTPSDADTWKAAQILVWQYVKSLGIDLSFQRIDEELECLADMYSEANGIFYIAYVDGKAAACIALRKYLANDCEMKRLYVSSEMRGQGLGMALINKVIAYAKMQGFERILLDTLPAMASAQAVYRK